MSQIFSVLVNELCAGLLFKDSIARPLHPIGAAPNATLRSLDLAGLRRGLAREMSLNNVKVNKSFGTFAGSYCYVA